MVYSNRQASMLTLMLTWACDMKCAHCCQTHDFVHLNINKAKNLITALHAKQLVSEIGITGGEPFLRYKSLTEIVCYAGSLGLPTSAVTNASWSKKETLARSRLIKLRSNGFTKLFISWDKYHAEFIDMCTIKKLIQICSEVGVLPTIYATYESGDPGHQSKEYVSQLVHETGVNVISRSIIPSNHNSKPNISDLVIPIWKISTRCPRNTLFTVWPDGRVLPCCTAGTHHNLTFANINRDTPDQVLSKFDENKRLKIIRKEGLDGLLLRLPEETQTTFVTQGYVSTCHACNVLTDILSDESIAKEPKLDIATTIMRSSALRRKAENLDS